MIVLILAATALTSGYFAHAYWKDLSLAKSSLKREQDKLRAFKKDEALLTAALKPGGTLRSLDLAVSQALAVFHESRVAHQVSISSITPVKGTGAAKLAVADISEPIKSTDVRLARLVVRGSYADYEHFLAYLTLVRSAGIAIGSLNVNQNNFELGVRIYGR